MVVELHKMDKSDHLQLTWKLHMNNFKDVIKDLQETECLSDVTLVCNDDTKIKAHKFVLTGSSPVLRTMLLQSSQRDTFVYLRGVKKSELEWALQFMYLGQTQVPQSCLQTFIELARDLKLKGIHNEDDNIEKFLAPEVEDNNVSNSFATEDIDNVPHEQENVLAENMVLEGEETPKDLESDLEMKYNVVATNVKQSQFSCHICAFVTSYKSFLKDHIERVHEGVRYPCDLCDYAAKRQQNIKDHKAQVHKIDPYYQCLVCNYCTNHTRTWKMHAEKKHPNYQALEIFKVTPIEERYKKKKP